MQLLIVRQYRPRTWLIRTGAGTVNQCGIGQEAEVSAHLGARHIHISTDMVFDGPAPLPVHGSDNPLCEYGDKIGS